MQSKDKPESNSDTLSDSVQTNEAISPHMITEDSVQSGKVPVVHVGTQQAVSELQPKTSTYSIATTSTVLRPLPLVEQPSESERTLREWLSIWWEGIRPVYLGLSLLPAVLGSVVAWTQSISPSTPRGTFHPILFVLTIIAVLLLQISAHLINDYYDFLRGIDTNNSLGPGGLIQQGIIKPARVLAVGLIALGLGALLGILIAVSSGWLVIVFGLIGVLAAYFYSGIPKGLSSLALGEFICFFIFGPLITIGSYIVQTGHVERIVYIYSISLGLLATAFIHLNNMRDAESDTPAGKLTLASLLGLGLSRTLYVILVIGAYAPIVALALPRHAPHILLIVLWTLPILVIAITTVL
ncbi:MAG TPA: 1,4-dihydroxy-2-naphthoate octaprenyltransferase, partial [Ktedonobacteraceae bacterium]|nr:1,4-dihydroxy-2-naphthoate octaprenyltransferase [Ktedonobacteraceae bacterium]